MFFSAQQIPYQRTGFFSKIVVDYLNNEESVQPFFAQPPTWEGLKNTIRDKKNQPVDRPLLVTELKAQYSNLNAEQRVLKNIEALASDNTFTVCTAHQPNLFTGPLYFMYKIIHAIKLADELKMQLPDHHFVPVYYMGSEDADFAELNHTYVGGKRLEWEKAQSGAVGRMHSDKKLVQLINELEGQLSVEPYGNKVIDLLRKSYAEGKTIQSATFEVVNELFGKYGLVVLIPDNANLKRKMLPVFTDDIFNQTPSSLAEKTSKEIEKVYNSQAHPREINLFYLKDDIRERIIKSGDSFLVHNTEITFNEDEMKAELETHPERFSPNVILRGLYQETILPNIAFIGGGGELAYWLQLKAIFQQYGVVYPVLVLRNSFAVVEDKWQVLINKLGIEAEQMFLPQLALLNLMVEKEGRRPQLNGELAKMEEVYASLSAIAANIDTTLIQHIAALKAKAVKGLNNLEKKMLRAERKRAAAAGAQIEKLKAHLFPNGGLQERVENFSSLYAKWGSSFIDKLYDHSLTLEQQFVVLTEKS